MPSEREAIHAQLRAKMSDYRRRVETLTALVEKETRGAPPGININKSRLSENSTKVNEAPLSPLDIEFYSSAAPRSATTSAESPSAESKAPRVVGRRGERALEAALREAARAQAAEDTAQSDADRAAALRRYLVALDYFSHTAERMPACSGLLCSLSLCCTLPCYTTDAPGGVLVSINRSMKALMARAEALKAALLKAGHDARAWTPAPDEVRVEPERVLSRWHAERLATRGVDTRLGALTATVNSALWNDSRPDAVRVTLTLERNVLILPSQTDSVTAPVPLRVRVGVDLRASVRVTALRVSLLQVRSACVRVRGPVTRATRVLVTQLHAHAQRFPLQGPAEFRGALTLAVPALTEPSECDTSASFALEYEVALSAILAYHDDVTVTVPLRIELAH